jgi:hypothetical protein
MQAEKGKDESTLGISVTPRRLTNVEFHGYFVPLSLFSVNTANHTEKHES